MIVKIKKNNITKLEVSGNPIKISGYYDSPHRREAPKLNSHRKKILKEFNIKDL